MKKYLPYIKGALFVAAAVFLFGFASHRNELKKVSDIEIKKNMPGAFSREKSDWKILSSPQVEYIFVDPKLNIASIYFTIGDKQIGVAYFEKGEGVWNRTQLIITCADCD